MPSARIADHGSEIKPVELWGDYGGVPVRQQIQPPIDADSGSQTGIYVNARLMALTGVDFTRLRTPVVFKPFNGTAINPAAAIWTPAAGKRFRLMGYHLVSSVAGNIQLKDGAGGTLIAVAPSAAGGPGMLVQLGNGILSAAINNVLEALGPAAATLSGIVFGTEE